MLVMVVVSAMPVVAFITLVTTGRVIVALVLVSEE